MMGALMTQRASSPVCTVNWRHEMKVADLGVGAERRNLRLQRWSTAEAGKSAWLWRATLHERSFSTARKGQR